VECAISNDLSGMTAVVTGSSSGIGRAIALAFAHIGVFGRREAEGAATARENLISQFINTQRKF
jgi:NAD(P)-dependent dehydrogenase (short-subunit alcohol dehydrogenase family)